MKFEHLVEINDLENPGIEVITREQLWRGLVLRAESPKMFMSYIDQCAITDRTEVSMTRQVQYGSLLVTDHVSMAHSDFVHYQVPAQAEIPSSSLRMTIEEPEPGRLFVRFCYDDLRTEEESEEAKMYDAYRRSAYHEADVDTVRVIRELAEGGLLNALIN
jgi:hypothetical protein